jgi:cell division protein FtsL
MNGQGIAFSAITMVAVAVIVSRTAYYTVNRKLQAQEARNAKPEHN